jgi:ankyrin repeat protein
MHAARSAEMVQLLVGHNADPNFGDDEEQRPLHWYAIRDEIAAMRAILQLGVEVSAIGPFEQPLHDAVRRNIDTVELLVEYGADVRERDLAGNTSLHWAANAGKIDVVRFLVERWLMGIHKFNFHDSIGNR